MAAQNRRGPPGGRGRPSEVSALAAGIGTFRNRPLTIVKQVSRLRRADFARDIVFAEFGYHNARAIDYGHFTDRKPHQGPRALLGGWRR